MARFLRTGVLASTIEPDAFYEGGKAMKYINAIALALVLIAAPVAVHAVVVYEQPWNSAASEGGAFSHATQQLAAEFVLSQAATINGATWFGTMFSTDPLDTGDTWLFNLNFYEDATGNVPGDLILNTAVLAAVTETGVSIGSEMAYRFDATLSSPINLDSGVTYWFSTVNVQQMNTFRWTESTSGLDTAMSPNGTGWNQLSESDPNNVTRTPLNFTLHGALTNSVPEPTSILLMTIGLAGLGFMRRKRKS
jgi:hypothetical protein